MTEHRGFLTDVDKLFLQGGKAYDSKQQRYERRRAIRERTREAFKDFAVLYGSLSEEERNKIFDVGESVTDQEALNEFQDGLVDTIAFMYLSLEGESDSDAIYHRSFRVPFDTILKQGVKKGEADRQPGETLRIRIAVDFDVDVSNMEMIDAERAIDKIARLRDNELTEKEMQSLLHGFDPARGIHGDWDDLSDRIRERRDEIEMTFPALEQKRSEQNPDTDEE
ncbi:hypothetical protein HWV07_04245 [Natronomonas salina]|uniref:hypothetical protein n=1 Tax=Natronomonas salina TaxID=1710540 RepID=UPI0015B56092|nr:hypothetical protein [Natronomonas salina]QLD88285.1 hypothetical protein HWV07_04245 [Natronomonas salina]